MGLMQSLSGHSKCPTQPLSDMSACTELKLIRPDDDVGVLFHAMPTPHSGMQ